MDNSLNSHKERYGLTPEEMANKLESTELNIFQIICIWIHPGILKELSETHFETLQKPRKDSKNKSSTYHAEREEKKKGGGEVGRVALQTTEFRLNSQKK